MFGNNPGKQRRPDVTDNGPTRRPVLETTGVAAGLAALPGIGAASHGWTAVESPVDGTLHDVVTTATGAYAVGDGGTM